jgi:hypothetical protein
LSLFQDFNETLNGILVIIRPLFEGCLRSEKTKFLLVKEKSFGRELIVESKKEAIGSQQSAEGSWQ